MQLNNYGLRAIIVSQIAHKQENIRVLIFIPRLVPVNYDLHLQTEIRINLQLNSV